MITSHGIIQGQLTGDILQDLWKAETLWRNGFGEFQIQRPVGNGVGLHHIDDGKVAGVERVIVHKGKSFAQVDAVVFVHFLEKIVLTVCHHIVRLQIQFLSWGAKGKRDVILVDNFTSNKLFR